MSSNSSFYFRPNRGEQISTTISPSPEEYSAIIGRIIDAKGKPVESALVLLFRAGDDSGPRLASRACTDEDGHFMFGPLEPESLYQIKVFKDNIKLRELEIVAD